MNDSVFHLGKSEKTSSLGSEEYEEIKRSLNGTSKPSKLLQRKMKRNSYQQVKSLGAPSTAH